MEPALPPLHPKLPRLLDRLELRIVEALKWNVLACARRDDDRGVPTHVVKFGSDPGKTASIEYEIRILRDVLPGIDQSEFERLSLPEYLDDGSSDGVRWVLMKHIKGRPLVYEWSELTRKSETLGGKGIGSDIARYSIDILRDLRSVNVSDLPNFVRKFSLERWVDDFTLKSETFVSRGFMEQATVDAALDLFRMQGARRYEGSMFTNGDFYPRNFIVLPNKKVAVVDWVGGVDPWEFVAMYAWLMMWGNPQWQIAYVKEIKKHFPVDIGEMQIGLLIKAFDQAYRWREMPEDNIGFARTQMLAYFNECLDLEYVRELFL